MKEERKHNIEFMCPSHRDPSSDHSTTFVFPSRFPQIICMVQIYFSTLWSANLKIFIGKWYQE